MRRLLSIFALCSLLLPSLPSLAQETPEEKSSHHNKLGLQYVDQGAFLDAVEEFKKAYKYHPKVKYLFNIARAYQVMGQGRNALDYYNRFIGLAKSEKKKARAQALIDELMRQLAVLTVEVSVEGAELTVNGDPLICKPSTGCLLDPGDQMIAVAKEGFATVSRRLRLEAGEKRMEPIELVAVLSGDLPTRSGAIWRSSLFPGMGQYYVGRNGAGTALLVGEIVCLGTVATGLVLEQYYLKQRTQDEGKGTNVWNDWTDLMNIGHWVWIAGAGAGGLVWAVNVIHAAAMPLPKPEDESSFLILPLMRPDGGGFSFAMTW
jgi:hypothetical protein